MVELTSHVERDAHWLVVEVELCNTTGGLSSIAETHLPIAFIGNRREFERDIEVAHQVELIALVAVVVVVRTTIDEVRIIDRHTFQIAIGEIVVAAILCCFVVVGILILTTTVTLIQTDIVCHQLREDGREVHADSHIVSDVTCGNVEGQDIFHIEVAAVQGILLKLIFNTRDDAHTGDGELIVVAAVDVALSYRAATSPLTNGQALELHHGVRQHRLIPVDGVHHRCQNTYIGIRSEVVPTLHITV